MQHSRQYALRLLLGEKRLLLRFAVTSIGKTALLMAAIVLIKVFLGGVLGEPQGLAGALRTALGLNAALWATATLLLVAFLGSAACDYDNTVTQQRIVRSLEMGVMERVVGHLLHLSVAFFDRQSHGDMIEAVRNDVARLRMVVLAGAEMTLQAMTAAGLLVTAVWMSPQLAFSGLSIMALAGLPIVMTARRIRRRSYGLRRRGYVLFDMILQMLRGIRIIKIYQGEDNETRHAIQRTRRYFDEVIQVTRMTALGQVALDSLGGLSIVVVTILGGFEVMHGRLAWPTLLAFIIAVRAAHGPLNNLNANYLQIQRYGSSVTRIDELLAERPTVIEAADPLPATGVASVEFAQVDFAYMGAPAVLRDVSFTVSAGEVLGIVGPSGAGKTTVLNLIARFYDPSSGEVRLNGRDIRAYRLKDVHALIAIVTQEPFLFAATVRENIRCGRPESTDEEVEAAARAADIHDEILQLPQGYGTIVGVAGRALSGGQVQRVNVARAILKNAPLLILDEATSSLDSIAEARVQKALARLMRGRTTFIAAHRLSTLRGATRILVLDRGRVAGLGRHDELIVRSSLYRQLCEGQVLGEPEPGRIDLTAGGGERRA
jgi:ABC-type multidrug transport system fused ATPase/permease subunit